ncbi:MAG: zinc-binding dehydrogenase, partial [Planctomycetota bacterium]|nr:zinc-binding dehydrogenase [Planctomycetota bacterium]
LLWEDLPDPEPKADEALVEVKACGVNHLDLWLRKGVPGHRYPLPMIPGNDIAGVVRKVGSTVKEFKAGDEVIVAPGISCGKCTACAQGDDHLCRWYGIIGEHRDGGYAELVSVPGGNLLSKPQGISFKEAAAFPLVFLTAWHMIVDRAGVREGEDVLVHAAGSGVGSAAIQVARLRGAHVLATAGSDEKLDRAKELGATHLIDYRKEDFADRVREITHKRGVDVIIDSVGKDTWPGNIKSLAKGGRLVFCGATSGWDVTTDVRRVFFKGLSILGSTMGTRGELREVLAHLASGRLEAVVDSVLPLEQAREAHRKLEAREAFGKIILEP